MSAQQKNIFESPGPQTPRARSRRLPLLFVAACGISLSLTLFFIVREAERSRERSDFERRADVPITAIKAAIDEHLSLMRSVASFYFSSREVDRDEFRGFTENALARLSNSVQAIAWAPRVAAMQRTQHEAEVRNEGFSEYEIAEIDAALQRRRAAPRAEYFPIQFVEPLSANRAMLGIDLAAETALSAAMARSVSRGDAVATPSLQASTGSGRLFRIVIPVYTNRVTRVTLAERRKNLSGYAVAVVRAESLISVALSGLNRRQLGALSLNVVERGPGQVSLFTTENWRGVPSIDDLHSRQLDLTGRMLEVIASPTGAFFSSPTRWQSWAVLGASLTLTFLVAGYMSAMWDRAAKIEQEVVERTAELARTNTSLTEEIATRKRISDDLARERYLVDALMDTMPDHIYFKDHQSRFLRVNKAMAESFKLKSPQEAVGKTDFDFFTAEHAQRAFEDEKQILRTGKPVIGREEKETWPDGSVTWVSTTKDALRDKAGQITGTFGISRDITARKKAEQALAEKNQELSRSNTELEQFAYVASHDLQEPLRMVASYTQLLSRRYKGRLDADADEFISYAVEGATRMQELINDLLAYSRVGTRGKPFAITDCNEVLKRTLANLKIAVEESRARIMHDPLPSVLGDPTQLTQLFQNLLSNAIKFRAQDTAPEIHIAVTSRLDEVGQPEWVLAFGDNGIGIEEKYFGRIFIIFQRLHTREQYAGTGIGLAVCKKIVERHGGRIWVESTPGKGSIFYLTLPRIEATA
ncbi:MAG: CHASE domain-containing protein [Verrucomicrobia subdivision 3 bacterium]|nr:CHASE domain-containing protein [Limisphaerales bacterium]